MTLDSLKELCARINDGDVKDALSFAVSELDYMRRVAQAYKETAEGRRTVLDAARTLSDHAGRRVDDAWQGSADDPASCWLVRDDDMVALRQALESSCRA